MNELDLPLGLDDTGRDRAHNRAAVAILGLTALAAISGAVGWFVLKPQAAALAPAIEPVPPALAAVPFDAPVLRNEIRDEPAAAGPDESSRTITIIDGKTGKRETILVGAGDDEAIVTGTVPR